jgi:hypothetical protein
VTETSQDARADTVRERDRDRTSPPSRWSVNATSLDVFWLILGITLVVAVIFVASVAQRSMNGVGVSASKADSTASRADRASATMVIVQVSSYLLRPQAQAAAQELAGRGIQASILNSNDYRPMNGGYFVVYTGPYPATAVGRAEAKDVQAQLPGSLVRDIQARKAS